MKFENPKDGEEKIKKSKWKLDHRIRGERGTDENLCVRFVFQSTTNCASASLYENFLSLLILVILS
jgi:hypothetical protein